MITSLGICYYIYHCLWLASYVFIANLLLLLFTTVYHTVVNISSWVLILYFIGYVLLYLPVCVTIFITGYYCNYIYDLPLTCDIMPIVHLVNCTRGIMPF